ncbi:MAG: Twinkle protein [Chthoniobacter sp.]|nr:Twinkle protein [Chthoniobacter sp.]
MDVMEWLQSQRKLDGALLVAMGVRPVQHEHLGASVAFPYRVNGKNVAAKFRTVDKRFMSSKGVSRPLYNIDALSTDQELPVVITEGEIDCLSVIQAGFQRCVSLPNGWTAQGNATEPLTEALEALQASPYVIVAGDNDEAGESLPRAVATILAGHDVRYAQWPDGCKDANDVLMVLGEGALAKCLNEAKRIDPPGGVISGFSDLPPLSRQRVLKIGKEPFDRAIALELGEVSVWTGLPGHGKSTLVTWAADEISKAEKVRVGMIGFETHPFRIRDQLCRSMTHRAWKALGEQERAMVLKDLDARWRMVHSSSEADHHLGWLQPMVRTLAVRDRCKIIVIDPWNELEHLPEKGESMTSYINFALKTIRNWAKALEIHICIVAHPAKIKHEGKPRPPTGYDVADSAAFFNKPGLGITVHPGDEEHEVQIINWKTRDTMLYGVQRGTITVEFAPAWGCYRAKGEIEHQASLELGE